VVIGIFSYSAFLPLLSWIRKDLGSHLEPLMCGLFCTELYRKVKGNRKTWDFKLLT
jgi:hypothetical protein